MLPPPPPIGECGERGLRHYHQDPAGDPRGGEDAAGHLQGSVPDPNPDSRVFEPPGSGSFYH